MPSQPLFVSLVVAEVLVGAVLVPDFWGLGRHHGLEAGTMLPMRVVVRVVPVLVAGALSAAAMVPASASASASASSSAPGAASAVGTCRVLRGTAASPAQTMGVGAAVNGVALTVREVVAFVRECYSVDRASSTWVVVNKQRAYSPLRYAPADLVVPKVTYHGNQRMRPDAAAALAKMFAAAKTEKRLTLGINSGYRSYQTQYSTYWSQVRAYGQAYADRWHAKPGHSEHQSGLTADLKPVGYPACTTHRCIGSTPHGAWLAANSWRFGFLLRYESGQQAVVGYQPEPWHFRYVGTALAADYHRLGSHALETYFGLPPAPR